MDKLLERVLEAHGGLDRWTDVGAITARLEVDGPFWDWRGFPQIRRPQTLTVYAHQQRLRLTPFTGEDSVATFEPDRVTILGPDGTEIASRANPAGSFPRYHDAVKWDDVQLAWFMGTANWAYFTEPFLFTYPGVTVAEIEPWRENGEIWRRLAVEFPAYLPNHNPDQVFFYGEDYLLRRMEYAPDVTGGAPIAHYVHDPVTVDGFTFYGRRSVHLRGADGVADRSWAPITIATTELTVL
nr:hypothetical protein [uncultured Actinoplanes sp.]